MWRPNSASRESVLARRPTDEVPRLLAELGLVLEEGLWTDVGHTVGVARSPAGLFVGWLDVGWVAPDEPFSELRDIAHLPERVAVPDLARDLRVAVDEALQARAEHLRDCRPCGERFVPGQMFGATRCHSCAVRAGDID